MTENVKFIFKTLLRVPIIILVCFAVLNVFAFGLSYFKLLGVAYVSMQTAIENNYIPVQEYDTLKGYLDKQETQMLENINLTCITGNAVSTVDPNTLGTFDERYNIRYQYGAPVTVTVSAHYRFVWPLMPKEQTSNGVAAEGFAVQGSGNTGSNRGSDLSETDLERKRAKYENNAQNNIVISYTVPGLKYYPDLS